MDIRIGHGFDVHCFAEGRKLILCGVEIPFEKGLIGHSDADVAAHAVTDALFGAAALGDIGRHFPDTDERYRGADSLRLLGRALEMVQERGFSPSNIDVTIIAQQPKLAAFVPQMVKNLANVLLLPNSRVNVKATTTEKLGFTGRGEGIAAEAVCLLFKQP